MKRTARTFSKVKEDDILYCYLGGCLKPAREFVTRGPNTAEPGRANSYRAYCKECHRTRNGVASTGSPLKSAGHAGRRTGLRRDPEVEYALGVIRDARGQLAGKQGYIYCIVEETSPIFGGLKSYCKIGFSTNPAARVAELQTGNPRKLSLLGTIPGTVEDEAAMHRRYIHHNVLQEWFELTPMIRYEFVKTAVPSDGEAKVAA